MTPAEKQAQADVEKAHAAEVERKKKRAQKAADRVNRSSRKEGGSFGGGTPPAAPAED